jgi:reactive intermediate/imine deaminase
MVVDVQRVGTLARDPAWRVVDARAPERYRGETEPIDQVAGHIPGARNYFLRQNLTAEGTFKSPADLRAGLDAAVAGADPAHVVCYCGSGVSACHNLLALEHAGLHGAKLYPGSWSEWTADPSRPIGRDGFPVRATNLPAPVGPYSPGMRLDRLVFVSGQGATDPNTGRLAGNDVETQTAQCLKNVEAILAAAGSSLRHVLRCGVFLVDMGEFEKMNAVYARVFGDHRPARTTVEVSRLPSEGLRVEIDAIAYVP